MNIGKNKGIAPVEKLNLDTQKMSIETNAHRKIESSDRAVEINADTQRHRFKREDLEEAIKDINKMILGPDSRFEFKVHERTGRFMIKLIDNDTDEIIKEIPPEKILDLVASIWDLVGILVDERG